MGPSCTHIELKKAAKVLEAVSPMELMRVSQAAAIAGLNKETLNRRIRKGELPAWGFPRRVRLEDVLKPYTPPDASQE